MKPRIIVFNKSVHEDGKAILVKEDESMEHLLTRLSLLFSMKVTSLLTENGAEIYDIEFIRDNDTLRISAEEEKSKDNWVHLNIGGTVFATCKSTVETMAPNSMLARMFANSDSGMSSSRDANGAFLIDRNPRYFDPILNYLRTGTLILDPGLNPEGVYEEAKYFSIDEILPELEALVTTHNLPPDERPLTRRDVIDAIITTPCNRDLRFQGINLAGADLSKLDLRHINFKYACLRGCNLQGTNLSWCNLERADLSNAKLESAQMLGVKMLCANLERASLKGCNFEDPAGAHALMEGANLRFANLESSQMAGVNLRVATLKYANMQNCDLRSAVLAGADMEMCNLSGSDLHEANLRGANLKDTAMELMVTPLHMSQTIR